MLSRTSLFPRAALAGLVAALALLSFRTDAAVAQAGGVTVVPPGSTVISGSGGGPIYVIVPQSRAYYYSGAAMHATPTPAPAAAPGAGVEITSVEVGAVIVEQAATTTMDIALRNPSGSRIEAQLLVPVPDGAAVRGFSFEGSASEPTAKLLPHDEAKKTYEEIVAHIKDPALLEFAGHDLVRSSVFPVPPNGTQKVRLTFEHLLPADGARVDYFLPRSESLEYKVPWKVSVKIKTRQNIATVYSPSHKIEMVRGAEGIVSVRVADESRTEPGPFRLSYLLEGDGVSASLIAYPDPKGGGGYFMLLAGLPAKPPTTAPAPGVDGKAAPGAVAATIKREVTIVLDRTGSMDGAKIQQARDAAIQVIAGLDPGEFFNILTFNEEVEKFANAPVAKSEESLALARAYIKGIQARGGTNLHNALLTALSQAPTKDTLPIILFLTDGLPTVGQTSEVAIREVAEKENPYHRRVFTFGVGLDVNTPLLEKIADISRGRSTFILPQEDVEAKVGQVFKKLWGPILAAPTLASVDASNEPAPGRVRDLVPARLPDLFQGDQLVVLGQYVGEAPLGFEVTGNYLGHARTFRFHFPLDKATTRNAFVPRLWASRRIGVLVQAIRDLGADPHVRSSDPKVKELADDIVRLSTEFGVLTEYTAFLAREGTDLSKRDQVLAEATGNFGGRAMATRSGLGSYNQSINNGSMAGQVTMNGGNAFYNSAMERVSISNVQQVNDQAFFQRNGAWMDGRLLQQGNTLKPDSVVLFGTPEYWKLSGRLVEEGRNGSLSLPGEKYLMVDGKIVQVK